MRCSVCDFEMGDAAELSAQVAAKGHDTPEEWGIDPEDATWMCGTHKDDIGDTDWDENEPYWYGRPSKSPEETMVALAKKTGIGYNTLVKAARESRLQARQSGTTWLSTRTAVNAALKAGTIQPRTMDHSDIERQAETNRRKAERRALTIYRHAYPDVDSKAHWHIKVQKIVEWLYYGDGGEGRTAEQLAAEWLEYDAE